MCLLACLSKQAEYNVPSGPRPRLPDNDNMLTTPRPIGAQYSGHVISWDQSQASIMTICWQQHGAAPGAAAAAGQATHCQATERSTLHWRHSSCVMIKQFVFLTPLLLIPLCLRSTNKEHTWRNQQQTTENRTHTCTKPKHINYGSASYKPFQFVSRMILIKLLLLAMRMVPLKCEFSIINGTLEIGWLEGS